MNLKISFYLDNNLHHMSWMFKVQDYVERYIHWLGLDFSLEDDFDPSSNRREWLLRGVDGRVKSLVEKRLEQDGVLFEIEEVE